jgi:DNA-binding NarL/FixJ family response regulator
LTEFSQTSSLTTASAGADAPIRVALVLASKLERLGWGIVVDGQADMQMVGQFASLESALPLLAQEAADVALVDEDLLTAKIGESMGAALSRGGPRFVLLARHSVDGMLARARYPFVAGCLLQGAATEDFLAAIRDASAPGLSPKAGGKERAPGQRLTRR